MARNKILASLVTWSWVCLSGAATVTVDPSQTFQTMQGFGFSQRLFKDPHIIGGSDNDQDSANGLDISLEEQNEILDKLHGDLGMTRMRLGIYPISIEPVNDNGDPDVTDLNPFNFAWKMNDGFFDYVNRSIPRGLTTWWHSPVNLEAWMNENNPEEYVEWAMAICRRWRDQGLEFPYWSIMNEPSFARGGTWSGEYLREAVKLLGAQFALEGFATKIVIPDDVRSTDAARLARVVLADSVARQYVDALAFHLYDEPVSNAALMTSLGETYGLPIWMTEFSVDGDWAWLLLMHDLISEYNVSVIDHLTGFGLGRGGYVNFNHNDGVYLGYVLPKKFYYVGQYSRYVRPGARRIEAISSDHNVKVTAFKSDTGMVVVAINTTSSALQADFVFTQSPGMAGYTPVFTNDNNDWEADGVIIPDGSGRFTFLLSPLSVTTFVGTPPSTSLNESASFGKPRIEVLTHSRSSFTNININTGKSVLSTASLFDVSGRLMARRKFREEMKWKVPSLSQGLYVLRVLVGGKQYFHRFHVLDKPGGRL